MSFYDTLGLVRVGEIRDNSEINEWFWGSTKTKVADEATKCSKAPDLSTTSRWLNGPAFLKSPEHEWPTITDDFTRSNIELKECNLTIQNVEPFINIECISC